MNTTLTRGGSKQRAGLHEAANGSGPELSVVVPIYNEEANVAPLQARLHEELEKLGRAYEILYVDDGSSDGSTEALRRVVEAYPNVRVIRFRRNFGQTAALQAGIENSLGEILVFMDGDLQNDPADIGLLLAKLDDGYDVVSGWRAHRSDGWRRTVPSRLANSLISWVTGVHLHDYGCTLKAYRRDVLVHGKLYGEMHRFIPAFASWSGATITELPVRHHPRRFGSSKYGLSRTLRVILDLMTVKMLGSYSTKPIYFFGFVGFGLWTLAVIAGLVVIAQKLLPPYVYVHNNPLILLAVFLGLMGVQFLLMGLLAELAIRTYHESQGKSIYVIREIMAPGPAARPQSAPAGRK
jgi:glycosyltransferase involved in cell wall biosynthesis